MKSECQVGGEASARAVGSDKASAEQSDQLLGDELSVEQSDQLVSDKVHEPNDLTSWSAVKSECQVV